MESPIITHLVHNTHWETRDFDPTQFSIQNLNSEGILVTDQRLTFTFIGITLLLLVALVIILHMSFKANRVPWTVRIGSYLAIFLFGFPIGINILDTPFIHEQANIPFFSANIQRDTTKQVDSDKTVAAFLAEAKKTYQVDDAIVPQDHPLGINEDGVLSGDVLVKAKDGYQSCSINTLSSKPQEKQESVLLCSGSEPAKR